MIIIPLIILILVILIIYLCIMIKKDRLNTIWPISILRFCLPIFSISLFGHIFIFLVTLFDCQDGHSYASSKLPCRSGVLLYFSPFIILTMILLVFIAFITNTLYYRSLFHVCKSDVLKKTNSIPDIVFLFTKIIITLSFINDSKSESEHWAILIVLMIVSGFNAYANIFFKNRLNETLMLLNIIFSLILFLGFFSLFMGMIFQFLGFNGMIYLFILGIICIFFFIILYKNKEINFALIDYKNINNVDDYINYILKYYKIISNKNNSRNNSAILKTYIETIEETCTSIDCPLKRYLEQLEKGFEYQYLLFLFLEKLFKYGISKFKNNIMIKNDYALFLLSKMNNKKQALSVLKSIPEELISFQRNYNIYRCKKMINNWPSNVDSFYFNYKFNINNFREIILKSSNLYYEFWSLLYESKYQHNDNFSKLYKIGIQIMKLNKKIEELYILLIKNKTNNIEIYKLYSEYIKNILKDEEKFQKFENITSIYSESFESEEKDYSNYNMDIFKKNDLLRYLLVAGNKKELGIILDCSLNASALFGYTKDEIIGKHINIFIPDIFQIKHNNILNKHSKTNNLKLFNNLFSRKEYNPNLYDTNIFGVFKSKFIESLRLKIYYIKTENNILSFLVNIVKETPYMKELIRYKIINDTNNDSRCCVLTNDNLLINSFTPNSIEQLGLSYRYIKSNNSIIPFIKQLYEDYLNIINDLNTNNNYYHSNININKELISLDESSRLSEMIINMNISSEMKRKIKSDLINKKYNKKCQITWRINKKYDKNLKKTIKNDENLNEMTTKSSRISHRGSNYNFASNKKSNEKHFEIEFLMEIKKVIIDNKLLGYYFFFSKLYPLEANNFITYTINDELNQNGEYSKLIKYKTIIKHPNKSTIISKIKNKKVYNSVIEKNKNNYDEIKKKLELSNSDISKKVKIKDNNNIMLNILPDNNLYDTKPKNQKEDAADEEVIDENYIPKCNNNFSFDLKKMCFNFEKDFTKSKILQSILFKEANAKLKKYQEYLNSLNNNDETSLSESNSDDDYISSYFDDDEDIESSNINKESSNIRFSLRNKFSSNKNLNKKVSIKKSISLKNVKNSKIEKIIPIRESYTLNKISEVTENPEIDLLKERKKSKVINHNNSISQQTKKIQGKYNNNAYYKVNLNKIHYLIYDFNKDMFVEGNKNEISLKVDTIINNIKKQNNIINIEKDEKYPFISFKSSKEIEKRSINKKEDNEIINDINKKSINDEERIFTMKISEAISSKKDEHEMKIFKVYSIISFIIMLFFSILIIIMNLYYYNSIKDIIELLKNVINIQYCQTFSIYFVRELTLLNFNVSNLQGGVYKNIPAINRKEYIDLMKKKLLDYFLENQSSLKEILSTEYSHSKNFEKNISETILDSEYMARIGIGNIDGDILSTLMQYNSVFYNLATSYTPLYQNHPDMFSFMSNSLNNFGIAIKNLYEYYKEELYLKKSKIFIYFITSSIVIFIILCICSYLMVISFISTAKKRLHYMQVFYGIISDSIKNIMSNCEQLINKIKKDESKNMNNEDFQDESNDIKTFAQKKMKDNTYKNSTITNSHDNRNKNIISLKTKLFFIFYIIIMIGMYIYYPYNSYTLYNTSFKAIDYSSFIMKLYNMQSSNLEIYNAYREYLFDNRTSIHGLTPFEYLIKKELEIFKKTDENVKYIQNFISKNIPMDEVLVNLFSKDLCSYYITDYFKSTDECKNKFGNVLNYDFTTFSTNFIQNMRNIKNIAKYKQEKDIILGELAMYEVEKWKTWKIDSSEQEKNNKKTLFRLDLFNDDTLHADLNLMFINIFVPYLDENRKELLKRLNIKGEGKYYMIYFILFILLLFLMYFFYLLPMIRYLNNYIYKTKRMLLLIPMQILSSQSNIKTLLNLS